MKHTTGKYAARPIPPVLIFWALERSQSNLFFHSIKIDLNMPVPDCTWQSLRIAVFACKTLLGSCRVIIFVSLVWLDKMSIPSSSCLTGSFCNILKLWFCHESIAVILNKYTWKVPSVAPTFWQGSHGSAIHQKKMSREFTNFSFSASCESCVHVGWWHAGRRVTLRPASEEDRDARLSLHRPCADSAKADHPESNCPLPGESHALYNSSEREGGSRKPRRGTAFLISSLCTLVLSCRQHSVMWLSM